MRHQGLRFVAQQLRDNALMCDVHLVETRRTTEPAPAGQRCSYCSEPLHGRCVIVAGYLDDGSQELYCFAYHEDCAWDMEHDDEVIETREGCFDYGTPLTIGALPTVVANVGPSPPAGASRIAAEQGAP